ncbi:protein BRANCHLESS TRICHOME [Dorcoceras hygrometricum]|uniref:Protein BRANCHLESS TRICHOME n=1 Tax=Dorcoceras hygrometricum TaxID=472368 RepID=A0A2Z7AAA6_9LAMI|nr:protein BRANCHLESS TRICHOME [Dorcoceras hygrometricum]
MDRYTAYLFLEVRTSMSYISPSSTSEGSTTRRFDLTTVYRPDPTTSSCENSKTPQMHTSRNCVTNYIHMSFASSCLDGNCWKTF